MPGSFGVCLSRKLFSFFRVSCLPACLTRPGVAFSPFLCYGEGRALLPLQRTVLTVKITETPELYYEAAKVVEERGWRCGAPFDNESPTCILGAVAAAAPGGTARGWMDMVPSDISTLQGLVVVHNKASLDRVTSDKAANIYPWNDNLPNAKGEEITVSILRRAGAKLRRRITAQKRAA